jgi:monofunctional glycosyltransferase
MARRRKQPAEGGEPGAASGEQRAESAEQPVEGAEPPADDARPPIKEAKPRAKSAKPRAKSAKPRAKSAKQPAENAKPQSSVSRNGAKPFAGLRARLAARLGSARAPRGRSDRSPFRLPRRIRLVWKRRARPKPEAAGKARRRWGWKARTALAFTAVVLLYLLYPLPSIVLLRWRNPTRTAFMERYLAQNGPEAKLRYKFVPRSHIAPILGEAVMVAEDDAFYEHDGVDFDQLQKSLEADLEKGRYTRGGSTITMQLAKNLYLSPDRSLVRKGRELILTFLLEACLSKDRILELYLNIVEWGPGLYGAEEASQHYFGKSASALDPAEAATLAAAISAPRKSDPASPSARLARKRDVILERLHRKGVLH